VRNGASHAINTGRHDLCRSWYEPHLASNLLASYITTRTTLDLDPFVLSALRKRGAAEGKSMGSIASELLNGALASNAVNLPPLRWTSRPLGVPRVNLEDPDALHALLDAER
jgi:hypothetical protein